MDKKVVSLLGLGILAYGGLSKININKALTRDKDREETEGVEETIVPGILLDQFVSEKYKISFKYPRGWTKNPRYEDKYEGTSGFFEVSDFTGTGENIDQAVNELINEPIRPYGSNPTVRSFVVEGQPARVIYPSPDQSEFINDKDAAIIIEYKQPITVDDRSFSYVVIWVSRNYVPLILSTFRFI